MNGEPVRYTFSFGVGNAVEKCNIVFEELSSSQSNNQSDKMLPYFRCHDYKIGQGEFFPVPSNKKSNRDMSFDINSKETIFTQFKDILLKNRELYDNELIRDALAREFDDLQRYLEGFRVYSSAEFDAKKMREPVSTKKITNFLNQDASNFTNVFNRYKTENILWKSMFEERMKELIPNLKVADTVNMYDKLIFKLVFNDEQYDLSDVSEGTMKGLILNMLINMPVDGAKSLLAIDEPETNLHPAWQKVVGNWIQTADTFEQCFVSTHSPDFLDVFTEEFKMGNVAVFVFDNNERIKKIKYSNIVDELGEWELGDLYRTNDPALGGWPW